MADRPRPVDLATQNIEPTGQRQMWDRFVGESARAFSAFVKFRDAADKRSMTAVAQELSCTKQNVGRWAFRWRWQERVSAFDVHQDQLHREEMARQRTDMNRRHMKLGILMQSIGAHAMAELQQKIEQKLPLNLPSDEARALMDIGSKIERAAHGPQREHGRYTAINVIYSTKADDPEEDEEHKDDALLLEGNPRRK
jgi:hypothetical protein